MAVTVHFETRKVKVTNDLGQTVTQDQVWGVETIDIDNSKPNTIEWRPDQRPEKKEQYRYDYELFMTGKRPNTADTPIRMLQAAAKDQKLALYSKDILSVEQLVSKTEKELEFLGSDAAFLKEAGLALLQDKPFKAQSAENITLMKEMQDSTAALISELALKVAQLEAEKEASTKKSKKETE